MFEDVLGFVSVEAFVLVWRVGICEVGSARSQSFRFCLMVQHSCSRFGFTYLSSTLVLAPFNFDLMLIGYGFVCFVVVLWLRSSIKLLVTLTSLEFLNLCHPWLVFILLIILVLCLLRNHVLFKVSFLLWYFADPKPCYDLFMEKSLISRQVSLV